jgi:hypothetical protein
LPPLVSFERHDTPTDGDIAMMNELQVFTEVASSDIFVYLSLVCALAFAAVVVGLAGQAPAQRALQASVVRRAL